MPHSESIRLPEEVRPRLVVVVDTEEEFDWAADFDRSATGVEAMQEVHAGQELFDRHGIRPVYVADYPVLTDESAARSLRGFVDDGRAEIGAHLHPWVTPPYEEEVNRVNSFAGNLPRDLERRKLARLGEAFEEALGFSPRVFKAGRYGLGPNTEDLLEELDYTIDLSAAPPFDFSAEGGPDYSSSPGDPYWFGRQRRLLGVPSTAAYLGYLRRFGGPIHDRVNRPPWSGLRVPGILARCGALNRLRLSPEGYTTEELCRLTRDLYDRGVRIFALSFHSPSLKPGCTPYVASTSDLRRFLTTMDKYFEFFLGTLGGCCTTASELREVLLVNTETSDL